MQSDDQPRPSMLSVPARWRELYFNVFSILCVLGELFLIWYEIYWRDGESDYIDIIMNILLDTGPVGVTAAILAFIMLKGRDTMLSTWETFSKKRFERGIEVGEERGREEREALAKRVAELEKQIRDMKNSNGASQC